MTKIAPIIAIIVFVISLLLISLVGISTEKRLGFYWCEVETTRDIYLRPFPMLKVNLSKSSRPLKLRYSRDGLEPEWIISEGYRDKGGKRIDLDQVLNIIETPEFQNRLDTDSLYFKQFMGAISPVVKDTKAFMALLKG